LESLRRARRELALAGCHLVALADDAGHLGAHLLDGDVERLEDAGRETLLLAQEAEKDVLGADVVVLQCARFVLGEDDDLASPFCESLEHAPSTLLSYLIPPATSCLRGVAGEAIIARPPRARPMGAHTILSR